MLFDDLISLDDLAAEGAKIKLFSKSTLQKIASQNYGRRTLNDFPAAIHLGGRVFWRKSAVLDWILAQEERGTRQSDNVAPIILGRRRGRPTNRERDQLLATRQGGAA